MMFWIKDWKCVANTWVLTAMHASYPYWKILKTYMSKYQFIPDFNINQQQLLLGNGLQYVFQIPKISSLFRVLTNLDDDMCEATPLCSAQSKATPAMLSSGGDSLECQFCEKV